MYCRVTIPYCRWLWQRSQDKISSSRIDVGEEERTEELSADAVRTNAQYIRETLMRGRGQRERLRERETLRVRFSHPTLCGHYIVYVHLSRSSWPMVLAVISFDNNNSMNRRHTHEQNRCQSSKTNVVTSRSLSTNAVVFSDEHTSGDIYHTYLRRPLSQHRSSQSCLRLQGHLRLRPYCAEPHERSGDCALDERLVAGKVLPLVRLSTESTGGHASCWNHTGKVTSVLMKPPRRN